jgi:hypothetical protein
MVNSAVQVVPDPAAALMLDSGVLDLRWEHSTVPGDEKECINIQYTYFEC